MKKLPIALGTGVLSLSLVLAGCTDASAPTAEPTASSEAPSSTATKADKTFVTMMIPHHQQAVEMSDIMLAKDDLDPQVAALAEQTKDAQGPEIDRMLGWLDDWGVEYDPEWHERYGSRLHGRHGRDDVRRGHGRARGG